MEKEESIRVKFKNAKTESHKIQTNLQHDKILISVLFMTLMMFKKTNILKNWSIQVIKNVDICY